MIIVIMPVSEKTLHILSGIMSSLSASAAEPLKFALQKRPGSLQATPQLYSAIPAHYRKEMERSSSAVTTTATSILPNGRHLVVHVISYSSADTELAAMWPLIHRWFAFAFSQTQDSRCTAAGLQVFIYLTGYKKRLPPRRKRPQHRKTMRLRNAPNSTLDYRHVNTAITTSCPHTMHKNTIVVFRKEEWLRALIHETVHFMGWDFSGDAEAVAQANRAILRNMWRGLPAGHDLRVYESFCDTWATVLQVLLLEREYGDNGFDRKNTIVSLLDKERRHSLGQCRKVMAHLGITWSDLEKPGLAAATYREKTPILAYYVLKSACMYFMDEFVGLFSRPPFQFPSTEESVRRFSGFLVRGVGDAGFRRSVAEASVNSGDGMRMSITGS